MIPNVRQEHMQYLAHPTPMRWSLKDFWGVIFKGNAGAVMPSTGGKVVPLDQGKLPRPLPGTVSILPHRVTQYRRPAFWNPTQHYKRQEYLVEPPNLPGTAIPYTLFHPVYIPGLQGYPETLPYNYAWKVGRLQNFAKWDLLGKITASPATGKGTRANSWKPAMRVPQGVGQGLAWQMPRPNYTPNIVNPTTR